MRHLVEIYIEVPEGSDYGHTDDGAVLELERHLDCAVTAISAVSFVDGRLIVRDEHEVEEIKLELHREPEYDCVCTRLADAVFSPARPVQLSQYKQTLVDLCTKEGWKPSSTDFTWVHPGGKRETVDIHELLRTSQPT